VRYVPGREVKSPCRILEKASAFIAFILLVWCLDADAHRDASIPHAEARVDGARLWTAVKGLTALPCGALGDRPLPGRQAFCRPRDGWDGWDEWDAPDARDEMDGRRIADHERRGAHKITPPAQGGKSSPQVSSVGD